MSSMAASEWMTSEHALGYLSRADALPHRAEGERVLLDHVSVSARRILDLGTGDGRLLALLRIDRPDSQGVGLDVSQPMLDAAAQRFAGTERVELRRHDMALALPDIGSFDAIVSCFAIHHLEHERKRSLVAEVFERLEPGGVFANLEHVASPTERLHRRFYEAIGYGPHWEDPSNRLLDVETQLRWLRETGFEDVDCYWKWLEMALLIGLKPGPASASAITRAAGDDAHHR
jgi:tRNA (cmo5U34)-methyltransferase